MEVGLIYFSRPNLRPIDRYGIILAYFKNVAEESAGYWAALILIEDLFDFNIPVTIY
jgi:hypothetical protein